MRYLILSVIIFIYSAVTVGQTKNEQFMSDLRTINSYLVQGKYKEAIPQLLSLNNFRPNTYSVIYNLAACYALIGQSDESMKYLTYLLSMDNTPRFDADSDFISLRSMDDYKILLSIGDEYGKFKSISTDAVTFNEKNFHPESIDFDESTQRWYSGSIRNGDIYEFDRNGKRTDKIFDKPSQRYSIFSVRLSGDQSEIYASASVSPNMERSDDNSKQQSALLIYDTHSGKLTGEYVLSGDHVLGDMQTDQHGNIYLSDSNSPVIYFFSRKSKTLTEFLTINSAWNLQGLTMSDDFKYLYAADYIKGIFKIEIASGKVTEVLNKTNYGLKGIDGIRFFRNSLIAVQNGVNPIRIVRLHLDESASAVVRVEVLEQNNPDLNEPTNGFIHGGSFYYLSNSPWSAYDRAFNFNGSSVKHPVIKRINLK